MKFLPLRNAYFLNLLLLLLGVILLILSAARAEDGGDNTCTTEGTCSAPETETIQNNAVENDAATTDNTDANTGADVNTDTATPISGICDGSTKLYSHGGTAQAYKPGAHLSSYVCAPEISNISKYKVASWPFNRRTFPKGTAPHLSINLKLWSCEYNKEEEKEEEKCQCVDLGDADAQNASSVVEIWQARPDGRYSTLRPLENNGECRAQVPLHDDGHAKFTTVAPGSTGIMAGLGPGGWEWNPYGPPVIHLLVEVAGHAPLLLDVPILFNPKTLEQKPFILGDWRGASWVRSRPKEIPFKISSWTPDVENNKISIELEIFVQKSSETVQLCQSWLYGLPGSFFLEPISMCGPSILNFFNL